MLIYVGVWQGIAYHVPSLMRPPERRDILQ